MSAYYRSTDPEVVASWETQQTRFREVRDAIGRFATSYGCEPLIYRRNYGLAALKGPKPEGPWRLGPHGGWVPHRGSKAGKILATEFDSLKADNLGVVPGMPARANGGRGEHGGLILCSYGALGHDGAVYVNWSCDEDAVENSEWGTFDASKWERIKASEYHLAKEAHDAEKSAA